VKDHGTTLFAVNVVNVITKSLLKRCSKVNQFLSNNVDLY